MILPFAIPAAVAAVIYLIRKQREYAWGKHKTALIWLICRLMVIELPCLLKDGCAITVL